MQPMLLIPLAVVAAALLLALASRRRGRRRQLAVGRLLDAADALETRLRTARAELEAVTGDGNPTCEALQEMLRQRLWLQQHGSAASLRQLDTVRASIDAARDSIEMQLLQIERARAPLH